MKTTGLLLVLCTGLCAAIAGCTDKSHPHGMPPGQAKKISGSKSAAPYAPGQQKKQ